MKTTWKVINITSHGNFDVHEGFESFEEATAWMMANKNSNNFLWAVPEE